MLLDTEAVLQQVVLVGAGMDTRAWRLHCWHPGTHLFEVDTPTMHAFKQRLMGGEAVAVSSRAAVIANASQPQQLEDGLVAAGCQLYTAAAGGSEVPPAAASSKNSSSSGAAPATLWLLEGFIGYLTVEEGNAVLSWMARVSAPGSVLLMTPPPTAQMREEVANMQPQQAQASAADSGSSSSAAAPWAFPAGGASPAQQQIHKLHHKTFEELTTTLSRVSAAGWQDVHCTTAEEYAAKYRVPRAQAVIRAVV
jgi:O-methyltransferase involved in polyketide biosynthesis